MKDKTNQIIKASISVFAKKGYLATTTKEIALKANVAEVTLYRKFGTKHNLFEFSVKSITEDRFSSVLDFKEGISTSDFLKQLLDNRLLVVSKNIKIVRMLISESLAGNLPKELRFTHVIFENVSKATKKYFEMNKIKVDYQSYSKIIGGILLGYAILPNEKSYHLLSKEEKEAFLNNYLDIIVN
ncbi:MAG: TetR/AcrR family transcriptional regulator [Candidatus Izimaplasma sp.]|nr:TetR/AcrR family transcriptional regulator [Candidatus Izimaplasma bacterium]